MADKHCSQIGGGGRIDIREHIDKSSVLTFTLSK
jgi:hypothetical protein